MGNTNTKTKFKIDFQQVYATYSDIVQKIILDGSFASKTDELLVWTNTYAECFNNCVKNKTPIESMLTSDKLKIIWAMHKLHPVIYHSREKIDGKWLADACVRQYGFCQKIYPLLSKKINGLTHIKIFLHYVKKSN